MNRRISQTTFKNVVLLTQNVEKTSNFYAEIVGLKLMHQTEMFAELRDFSAHSQFSLMIRRAPSLAHSTFGYSPILNFNLGSASDIDELVQKAKSDFDCDLDGQIVQDEYLKLACLRTPDGQTLQLTQQL